MVEIATTGRLDGMTVITLSRARVPKVATGSAFEDRVHAYRFSAAPVLPHDVREEAKGVVGVNAEIEGGVSADQKWRPGIVSQLPPTRGANEQRVCSALDPVIAVVLAVVRTQSRRRKSARRKKDVYLLTAAR